MIIMHMPYEQTILILDPYTITPSPPKNKVSLFLFGKRDRQTRNNKEKLEMVN